MNFLKRLFGRSKVSNLPSQTDKKKVMVTSGVNPNEEKQIPIKSPNKSDYWQCPKCGGLLKKGFTEVFNNLQPFGIATCSGCGAEFNQSIVYDGKYDVFERIIDPSLKFRIIGTSAFWGNGHEITFNKDYTKTELFFMLDGKLFPVSSNMTKAECRQLVESNFPIAFEVVSVSNWQLNLPTPKESDGYTLAISKLHLSYAVRNNVSFAEAVRIFRITMDY